MMGVTSDDGARAPAPLPGGLQERVPRSRPGRRRDPGRRARVLAVTPRARRTAGSPPADPGLRARTGAGGARGGRAGELDSVSAGSPVPGPYERIDGARGHGTRRAHLRRGRSGRGRTRGRRTGGRAPREGGRSARREACRCGRHGRHRGRWRRGGRRRDVFARRRDGLTGVVRGCVAARPERIRRRGGQGRDGVRAARSAVRRRPAGRRKRIGRIDRPLGYRAGSWKWIGSGTRRRRGQRGRQPSGRRPPTRRLRHGLGRRRHRCRQ